MSKTTSSLPFKSGHSRVQWVTILLAVSILADVVGVIALAFLEPTITLLMFIVIGQSVIYLTTWVFFLMWIYRSHRNLSALGAANLKFSHAWAVGWWFVPIMNFFRPYQVMKEIWKASDPNTDPTNESSWQKADTSSMIGWWWMFYILSIFVKGAYRIYLKFFAHIKTLTNLFTMNWVSLLLSVLLHMTKITAAVFAILIIRGINARQEEKSQRLAISTVPLSNTPLE